jgi:hypothetical protein
MRETAKREIWDIVAGQRVGLQGPRALTEGAGKYCRCHTKTETHPKPMLAFTPDAPKGCSLRQPKQYASGVKCGNHAR